MKTLLAIYRLVVSLFGTALVMLAWSEFVFFNEDPAQKLIDGLDRNTAHMIAFVADMGAFYLIPSAFLVGLVGLFGSHGSARKLLIGALTGLSIEGAVVPAIYEAVPISYFWTSIAWHGPITVALGVFVLPRLMAEQFTPKFILITVALGISWGVWTTWIWADDTFEPLTVSVFATYSIATTGIMILGYWFLQLSSWPAAPAPRWVNFALLTPTAFLFVVQGSVVPFAAIGLLVILSILLFGLSVLGHKAEEQRDVRASKFLALTMLPVTASLVYLLVLKNGLPLHPEDLVALTFVAGMIVWVVGVVRGIRQR